VIEGLLEAEGTGAGVAVAALTNLVSVCAALSVGGYDGTIGDEVRGGVVWVVCDFPGGSSELEITVGHDVRLEWASVVDEILVSAYRGRTYFW
jgi:hypothetical protein